MKNTYTQQGDILLARIEESDLPNDLYIEEHPRIAGKKNNELAYGEAHGHCHLLNGDDTEVEILQSKSTKDRFVRVFKPVILSHEEHLPQTIETGLYKFNQVVEFDPFNQFVRTVID